VKKNYLQNEKRIVRNSLTCFSFILLLFLTMQMYAQNPQCQWAEKITGTRNEYTNSISSDVNGNVFLASAFVSDTLTFNNGIIFLNSGGSDGYIAKYNSSGICQWAEKIAGTDGDYARSISTDANGNVYVAGDFWSDTLTFNNEITLSKSDGMDVYIAKYNSEGICQWAEKIAGTDWDNARSIITDVNGNVYVAGNFSSYILTFNNGISLSGSVFSDVYIAKYNNDGVCQWAEKIAGESSVYVYSISTDANGNMFVAGNFGSDTLTFNNGITLSNSGANVYIAKYNSDGVCQWAEKIDANGFLSVNSISTDAHCNVYVAGDFSSYLLTFNNGISLSCNYDDVYLAKYDSDGVCQWAEKIAGNSRETASSIITVPNGNVYVAGEYDSGIITFNNGITISKSGYYKNVYITKYNSNGICQWAEKIAGTEHKDLVSSISTDAKGNVYLAGDFYSATLIFNNGITLSNTNSGEMDSYIAKYTESPQGIPFLSSSTNNAMLFLSPNPVNENSLNIAFNLLTPEQVTIEIANMLGEVVSVVKANEFFPQGEHSSNADISNFLSGYYFCILRYKDKVYQQQFIRY